VAFPEGGELVAGLPGRIYFEARTPARKPADLVVAVLDVRKKSGLFAKGFELCTHNAKQAHKQDPMALAVKLQEAGAGEIVVNSIDRDGLMQGYDLDLAAQFRKALRVPVTFLGGAGSLDDIGQLVSRIGVVGAAVGSLFVFKGKYRAVLINYPTRVQKTQLSRSALLNHKS
jgi:cyclase